MFRVVSYLLLLCVLILLVVLAVSLLIAEFLYRFGSFTLEAVAFLATWYAGDAVLTKTAHRWRQ